MTENDNADWFDPDIAAMDLGYGEKAGLQIYRNYTRSFETRAIEFFVAALNELPFDTVELERFSSLLVTEESRFLPIITCAFADDLLLSHSSTLSPITSLAERKICSAATTPSQASPSG